MNTTNEQQPQPAAAPVRKTPSRGERFTDAAQALLDAIDDLGSAWEQNIGALEDALEELRGIQEEYEEWLGDLPEKRQSSTLGEKLQAIVDISLDDIEEPDFDNLESAARECLDADIPG